MEHNRSFLKRRGIPCGPNCWLREIYREPNTESRPPCWDIIEPSKKLLQRQDKVLYQPLDPWQTRIIELLPGTGPQELRCRLLTVNLIDMEGVGVSGTSRIVQYDALSYSWGRPDLTATIVCNGEQCAIGPSLAVALQYLRQEQGTRYIWCDALCINQRDNEEKAQQVRSMLRIFEKAYRVVAWLGEPQSDTGALFQGICSTYDPSRGTLFMSSLIHGQQCLSGYARYLTALETHLRRDWFQRTWVRQEVFAAEILMMQCGAWTIDFRGFMSGIRSRHSVLESELSIDFFFLQPEIPRLPKLAHTIEILENVFQHSGTDRGDFVPPSARVRLSSHWLRILKEGSLFKVRDPRDRIYAALGIIQSRATRFNIEHVPDVETATFPIDYARPVSAVYQDVVKYMINTNRNLDILQVFEDRGSRAEDLPSWALDWRQKIQRSFIQRSPNREYERRKLSDPPMQDLNDVGRLTVRGVQFGPVDVLDGRNQFDLQAPGVPSASSMDSSYEDVLRSGRYILGKLRRSPLASLTLDEIYVPRAAMVDDIVVALAGARCLFLLRPLPSECFGFVGPVCVVTWWAKDECPLDTDKVFSDEIPDWTTLRDETTDFILV